MLFHRPQLASYKTRFAGLALLLAPLLGCQNIVNNNTQVAQIRFINATPIDVGGLDMYLNGTAVAYNLGAGSFTSYVPVNPGTYTVASKAAGSTSTLVTTRASLANSKQYTAVVGGETAGIQELVLSDQSQPAPGGEIAIRFLDQATHAGAVDIYLVPTGQKLTAVNPVLTNVSFNTNTGYLDVPTADYSIVLLPTGTVPTSTTTALYTGALTTYPAGSARTDIILDNPILNTPGFTLKELADYDSATSTSPQ